MPNEVSRLVVGNKIVIEYDDGKRKTISLVSAAQKGVIVDQDEVAGVGHVFSQEKLSAGGYND